MAVACVYGNDGRCAVRIDVVIAGPADDKRGSILRVHVIVPGAGIHEGVAFPILHIVGPFSAKKHVIAGVAFDVVVTRSAIDVVVSRSREDIVIAAQRGNHVVLGPARKEIAVVRAGSKRDAAQHFIGIPNRAVRELDAVQCPCRINIKAR